MSFGRILFAPTKTLDLFTYRANLIRLYKQFSQPFFGECYRPHTTVGANNIRPLFTTPKHHLQFPPAPA